MTAFKAPELKISDHALMSWLERSGAMDAGAMKDLLAKTLHRSWMAARAMSQSEFLILVDGLVYVVQHDTVVTVLPNDGRHARRLTSLAQREQDQREQGNAQ